MTLPEVERERLDVVDGHDRVIASATRGMIHRAGLWHRAAHVLLFNRAGDLFLQRRAWWKDSEPGAWDSSAAGHLAAGEDYPQAAARELAEELGLTAPVLLSPLFRLPASAATGFEFVTVFRGVTDQILRPDPLEVIDGRWCGDAELAHWLGEDAHAFTTSFRTIWEHCRSVQVRDGVHDVTHVNTGVTS
ncbi:MAG: NUDIX domain-containing protein [Gammaproteobacteria bacterium]